MKASELYTDAKKKLDRAFRASAQDGRLRYVYAPHSHGFYLIVLNRPTWTDVFWTNGKRMGLWKASASQGVEFEAE